MDNLVKELIKLDEKARSITAGAEEDLGRLDSLIAEGKEKIKGEIGLQTASRIKEIQADNDAKIACRKEEIASYTKSVIENLEKCYADNADIWKREIINAVKGQ